MPSLIRPALVAVWPAIVFAQDDPPLIQGEEFLGTQLGEDISCETAQSVLYVIYRLGDYEVHRFGATELLQQILQNGCDEFSIDMIWRRRHGSDHVERFIPGRSERDVVEQAISLLEAVPPQRSKQAKSARPSNEDALCVPVSLEHPDDLGMLLYLLAADIDPPRSPLYELYETVAGFCNYRAVWDDAFAGMN